MRKISIASVALLLIFSLLGCGDSEKSFASPVDSLSKPSFPSGWSTFTNANEMITDLAFDHNGHLWAASRGGLVMWDTEKGTYKKYTTADGLPVNRIDALFVDKNNMLWIGASGGIISYDQKTWVVHKGSKQDSFIEEIFRDDNGILWFVGNDVTAYDGKTWKTYTIEDGLGSNSAASIVEDKKGDIWLGTWFFNCGCEGSPTYHEGVSRFDGRQWDVLGKEIGLDDNDPISGIRVNAMAVDDQNGIWFGTDGYGAKYYNGTETKSFTVADGLSDNKINDIQIDGSNMVWFATNHGTTAYDGKKWETFFIKDGLAADAVYSIAIAPDHSIWFGTADGISRWNGAAWTT